jgi:hypothetical protein
MNAGKNTSAGVGIDSISVRRYGCVMAEFREPPSNFGYKPVYETLPGIASSMAPRPSSVARNKKTLASTRPGHLVMPGFSFQEIGEVDRIN